MKFRVLAILGLLCPVRAIFAAPSETNYLPAASQLDRLAPTNFANDSHSANRINNADLLSQPELAKVMLDQAVREGQWPVVRAILPVYSVSLQPDMMLIHFARGGLARSEGHYDQAIKHYRAILSAHPDFNAVRLEMARAMYENRQTDAAEYQFRRVLSSNPPENIQQSITKYLELIQQGSPLRGMFSISYLNDSNVNNASSDDTVHVLAIIYLSVIKTVFRNAARVHSSVARCKKI
ncbi:tetratricopeptide repeat protein [Klebsiella sp. BIGb0407]|uniref:tetratricopeptide repeat protein n=1 Tax=Klebsiella sp. BIGb0407 TaxID=2940603 RepID=UPI002167561C|nr:tetratricopeptide repeat protein [Klebsiella sp. BIGb0407]MCS3434272.1 tetratricopeptide (TPR) repeat protein [Klebsiella sp. BIGb0407]